ncbi:protein CBFA2T3-like isoform X1 [Ailuropoda melanoleuca]|uniref:protein CBFA2T3-like isoform X1 n=1 Tax=Ailuropoda melanoleuca TaxID=9646 RepID=UPI001494D420|nr:protein CBFA2T3-like isoform X1 [Ailuropoda melanoleuca]
MAEKTRRSLTVLRQCQEADREELNHWIRRYSDTEDAKKGPMPATARPLNSSAGTEGSQLDAHREFMPRTLSGYMPEEIWRKAGECRRPGGGGRGLLALSSELPSAWVLIWQSSQGSTDPAGGSECT